VSFHVLRGPRALVSEVSAALSGSDPARARMGLALYASLVTVAWALAWAVGAAVYRVQSARVATLASVVCAIAFVLACAPLVGELLRRRGKTPAEVAPAGAAGGDAAASTAEPPVPALRARIVCGVLFAAIEDGLVSTSTTLRADTPFWPSLGGGATAACALLLPLTLLALPIAFVLSRPAAATFAARARVGLGGEDAGGPGLGTALYVALAGAGAYYSWQVGLGVSENQSAEVAVLASTASAVAAVLVGAVVVATIARPLAKLLGPIARRVPSWLPLENVVLAALGVGALYVILPQPQAITPAAGVVGFALGPHLAERLPSLGAIARLPLLLLLALPVVITGGTFAAFERLPDAMRTAVVGRAPYAGLIVGAVKRPKDTRSFPVVPFKPPVQAAARDLSAPPMRDNIVLIHIEALRPDHVGFIGYKRPTTPRIDRFRETATWFKNAYSLAPTTRFALSMLFTGKEIERIPQARGHAVDFTLLPEALTVAERLEPLGYDRVGYTLSYVIQHIKDLGQGFRIWQTPWALNDWEKAYQDSAKETTDAAINYLSQVPADGSKPYYLFLHYMSNHDPYIKHAPWDYGNEPEDLYDSALNYEDDQLGRLFDALDSRADKDHTAIFLYSDHGELFGEHGYHRHGFTLYQPDIQVVLLVRVPGANAVKTIDTQMLLEDITPTVFELTGLPPDPDTQTWDLLPYLRGTPMPPRPIYLYSDQWRTGVHYVSRGIIDVDGHTKLIHNISVRSHELYDIAKDPTEHDNLANDEPEVVARLSGMVDGWHDYQNPDHKSFETSNKEVKEKQDKMPLPVFK
jgi:arylsulfatase A-like enzyme